jgi:ubiquinone/menaquinone biosynthesis C-methylase UbiE
MCSSLEEWTKFITDVLSEVLRVLKPKGRAVIEVGEVESGNQLIFLDEVVAKAAERVTHRSKRLIVDEVLINQQNFTKLANCFNVDNNRKGTNTNRLVVLKSVSKTRARKRTARA